MKNTNNNDNGVNVEDFYNSLAHKKEFQTRKSKYYKQQITKLYIFLIPKGQKIIELGCGSGDLLASLKPTVGTGVDFAENMIKIALKKYPRFRFIKMDAGRLTINQIYDYVIMSDLIGILEDIQNVLHGIHKITNDDSRIIISYNNYLWEPVLTLASKLGFKTPQPKQSWIANKDIANLLELADFEIIKKGEYLLIPIYIPFISSFLNTFIAHMPIIRNFCFVKYIVARKKPRFISPEEHTVSIILPARNEAGNIERGVREIPKLGKSTQLIFVEDHSTDNTREEIEKVMKKYQGKKEILYFIQTNEFGKAAAVRKGFDMATGDILIIFDSDLSTDPSELPKFYSALNNNKAEFIQGSRLIYPIEKDAMRFLNILGNKFFSVVFTFLLDQQIKDTLCGTKAIFKKNYLKIVKNRAYFGDFDPFGDFDLIFGASKLNLKIIEIPIRYKARVYGSSNIHRFRHGWLLWKMTIVAANKIKFF